MVTRRTAKNKGSQFEMDCKHSLIPLFPDILRLGNEGFQAEHDLRSEKSNTVFECKRLKGISWNELVKIYKKLESVTPEADNRYILFKPNKQPCLVFYWYLDHYQIEIGRASCRERV